MNLSYIKPEKLFLKTHPALNEKWVQEIIAKDPSILGLGNLILKDKERIQPHAGRLDIALGVKNDKFCLKANLLVYSFGCRQQIAAGPDRDLPEKNSGLKTGV